MQSSISRDSENPRIILIHSSVTQDLFAEGKSHSDQAALRLAGSITMRIDLDGTPLHEVVNGKDVYIPAFTLENASIGFTTEGL